MNWLAFSVFTEGSSSVDPTSRLRITDRSILVRNQRGRHRRLQKLPADSHASDATDAPACPLSETVRKCCELDHGHATRAVTRRRAEALPSAPYCRKAPSLVHMSCNA